MVFEICTLSGNWPVVYMYIEEVHVDRDLHALSVDVFLLKYLLDDNDLTVSNSFPTLHNGLHSLLFPSSEKEDS